MKIPTKLMLATSVMLAALSLSDNAIAGPVLPQGPTATTPALEQHLADAGVKTDIINGFYVNRVGVKGAVIGQQFISGVTNKTPVTIIDQFGQTVKIKWDDFSSNPGDKIIFYQPNANSLAINQVTSGKVSNLQGMLQANGKILIMNDAGVVFAPGSVTNVGALAVTTAKNIQLDDDTGKYTLSGFNNDTAVVKLDGKITSKGYVTAVARKIEVGSDPLSAADAQIKAGNVNLYSGMTKYTVDLKGDGAVQYASDKSYGVTGVNIRGNINSSGAVIVNAKANNLTSGAINLTGVVDNTNLGKNNKRVVFDGNDMLFDGTVKSGGTVKIASASNFTSTADTVLNAKDTINVNAKNVTTGVNPTANAEGNFTASNIVVKADTINSNTKIALQDTADKGSINMQAKGTFTDGPDSAYYRNSYKDSVTLQGNNNSIFGDIYSKTRFDKNGTDLGGLNVNVTKGGKRVPVTSN